jgi:hypothetical protein
MSFRNVPRVSRKAFPDSPPIRGERERGSGNGHSFPTDSRHSAVSRDRDRSRGDLTKDRTRDGKGDATRDHSRNHTNDKSRNDTR